MRATVAIDPMVWGEGETEEAVKQDALVKFRRLLDENGIAALVIDEHADCDTCEGKGWIVCCDSTVRIPPGAEPIQRCDSCDEFDSDEKAAQAALADYPGHTIDSLLILGFKSRQWFLLP